MSSPAASQPAVDVLVIGAGAAGLAGALAATRTGASVLVVCTSPPEQSHSTHALGGMNGVLSEEADPLEHARDTVLVADYLADQDAVETMCLDASTTIERLLDDGVPMRRALLGRTGHWPYTLPDITGRSIVRALSEALRRHDSAKFQIGVSVIELLCSEGRCTGARIAAGDATVEQPARAVLLATGGFAHLYRPTVASPEATGDGLSLAYRAGAQLMDLEFVQYHPTAIAGTTTLVSERARGAGARLYNASGERFMERYAPGALELAPRDVVSRAIAAEIEVGRGCRSHAADRARNESQAADGVLLDFREVPGHRWDQLEFLRGAVLESTGCDVRKQAVLVAPAVHYTMGGVRTDTDGHTSLTGLWAAGEVACVSVHGANRLGGNSLLETVVFGTRAGTSAAMGDDDAVPGNVTIPGDSSGLTPCSDAEADSGAMLESLRELMHRHGGIRRDRDSLKTGLARLAELRWRRPGCPQLELAEAVLSCALARTESRGAHYRKDHPEREDGQWLSHSVAQRDPQCHEPLLSHRPVTITRWPPAARGL